MRIGFFGCSHVGGFYPTYYNLAEEVAAKCPQHEIHDYSFGGHSQQMILYLFEKFKQEHDFNIVKITSPGRLSFFNNVDFAKIRKFKTSNFNTWSNLSYYGKNVVRMNYSSCPLSVAEPKYSLKSIKKLHKMYYSHISYELANIESLAITKYLQSSADFVYAHRAFQKEAMPDDILCTEKFLLPNYQSYVIDEGYHLGLEGTKAEAEWLINNIKELNHA
jgi:hypothetical protein